MESRNFHLERNYFIVVYRRVAYIVVLQSDSLRDIALSEIGYS